MVQSSGGSTKSVIVVVLVVAIIASAYLFYMRDLGDSPISPGTYTDHEPIVILSDYELAQQALLNEWNGNGTCNNPFIIEGLKIVTEGRHCIKIENVIEYHFMVRNCHLIALHEALGVCIKIYHCTNGAVENCTMETGYLGADIFESSDCRVSNCNISGVGSGVNLTKTERILVDKNWVEDCWWALMLFDAHVTTVSNNHITSSEVGLNSHFSSYTYLDNNAIIDNLMGLNTENSCMNWTITNCSVLNNTETGIKLTATTENFIIFRNQIGWNGMNARDDGFLNKWDDGDSYGNAWSDYSGSGLYIIPGSSGSVDNSPSILV